MNKHSCIGLILSFIFAIPILVSILILIIGLSTNTPTVIYQGFCDGKKIIVLGANTITYSNIKLDIHDYWDNSIIVVYNKKYRKFSSIEPCAIFEKRRLIYYNPLFETNTSSNSETIKHLIRSSNSNPRGKVASIYRSYLMKSDNNYNSNAIIEVKANDIKTMKDLPIKDLSRIMPFKKFAKIESFIELHRNEKKFLKKLNRLIYSDIPCVPLKIVITPHLKKLPSSIDEILPYLPANHRILLETAILINYSKIEDVKNYNPIESIIYYWEPSMYQLYKKYKTKNIKKYVSDYFDNKELDILNCYFHYSDDFYFTCILAYDINNKRLYSFILNLNN